MTLDTLALSEGDTMELETEGMGFVYSTGNSLNEIAPPPPSGNDNNHSSNHQILSTGFTDGICLVLGLILGLYCRVAALVGFVLLKSSAAKENDSIATPTTKLKKTTGDLEAGEVSVQPFEGSHAEDVVMDVRGGIGTEGELTSLESTISQVTPSGAQDEITGSEIGMVHVNEEALAEGDRIVEVPVDVVDGALVEVNGIAGGGGEAFVAFPLGVDVFDMRNLSQAQYLSFMGSFPALENGSLNDW
ncbi:uncharacterized protein [Physcomitrium patens]|uniref:Uncharacterized protein n=1 Tax=Physcomitrium patens TaxID=3218 RepID=A0A2K1KA74_PHYPA|nr:uncharacterized protein LOC112284339 isoform X1 [Physcomitrium patens]PNR50680.1 hypothetical protein PHYPA_009866 [Physcomitrium patens]|eukprot:XP_024379822.1 uncharacterized protein LOC112284339 isoform X1 [Physcomitrella patens]